MLIEKCKAPVLFASPSFQTFTCTTNLKSNKNNLIETIQEAPMNSDEKSKLKSEIQYAKYSKSKFRCRKMSIFGPNIIDFVFNI